jgi:hypothetical protein
VNSEMFTLVMVWISVFCTLESLRRAAVRKNREAREARDPFSPTAPMTDGGPVHVIEHKNSTGGRVVTDAVVPLHRGEMVVRPGGILWYDHLPGKNPFNPTQHDTPSPQWCGYCGAPNPGQRCGSCGATPRRTDVELRK